MKPSLHIALLNPEIGPNTGNIGRLCLGIEEHLHLIHPLGFQIDDKAVRRAGLDYWKHVQLHEHTCVEDFWKWAGDRQVLLFSTSGEKVYTEAPYREDTVLLFGRETKGLPKEMIKQHGAWRIPMSGHIRSINLANAVAVVAYQALQDIRPGIFDQ